MAEKRACPVCQVAVNRENLKGHMVRVHPRSRIEIPIDTAAQQGARHRKATMSRRSRRLLGAGAASLGLLLVGIFLASTWAVPRGGTIHIDPASYDFGDIEQTPVSTTFRIHNRATSTLVLQGLSTSCMCTTTRVVFAGQTSPTFGYHENPSGWSLALPSAAEAYLEVFYDPTVHPELGPFERQVYVLSSDPDHREASVSIHGYEV